MAYAAQLELPAHFACSQGCAACLYRLERDGMSFAMLLYVDDTAACVAPSDLPLYREFVADLQRDFRFEDKGPDTDGKRDSFRSRVGGLLWLARGARPDPLQPPLLIKPQILEVRSAPLSALRIRLRSSADLISCSTPAARRSSPRSR